MWTRALFLMGQPHPVTCGQAQRQVMAVVVAVHIVTYTHYFGFIPGKKQVDHLCNQRLCCNPAHLNLVTHLTNQRRRDARTKEAK